jgi:hypothetical protein
MNANRFIILFVTMFLVLCSGYFLMVDKVAVAIRDVPSYYKYFLLLASKNIDNKIIIDSGSNSNHAINAQSIESEFKRFTINISDNAGFPLAHKLYRMRPFLNSGDLVILPLEWNYYFDIKGYPQNYVSSILSKNGKLDVYYDNIPFLEKVYFIYRHVPFNLAVKRIFELNSFSDFNQELSKDEVHNLIKFSTKVVSKNRGGFSGDIKNFFGLERARSMTCDDDVAENFISPEFDFSPLFINSMQQIRKLSKETGARFIFTLPTVVEDQGNGCYSSENVKKYLPEYILHIKAVVSSYGAEFIGSIDDSVFGPNCFWDSHYHIDHKKVECVPKRTKALISDLIEIGIAVNNEYDYRVIHAALNEQLTKMAGGTNNGALPINETLKTSQLLYYVSFVEGWTNEEAWGRWSLDNSSLFSVYKGSSSVKSVRISGKYFNGEEETSVWINDYFVGSYTLTDSIISIPEAVANDQVINIKLEHKLPVSPLSLGISSDPRNIKFGITEIEFLD